MKKPGCYHITNNAQCETTIKKIKPDRIIHLAAMTNVDQCEIHKDLAMEINYYSTKFLASEASKQNIFFLYVSTDYVFNGEKGNYKETDQRDPINYYGFTKLKAEEIVNGMPSEYCIARASVIYGSTPAAGKVNFALWLLDKLKRKEQAKIVTDQWNSPTLNTNLAEMTLEVMERKITGIFHLSGAARINRYDFARQIAEAFNLNSNLIIPTTSAEFSWIAKRPKDSSLDTAKA